MLYIYAKFHEIISNGIKVISKSIGKITKGDNSAKNAGVATVVNVCTSYNHALYFYQVL